jgi:hypothetical protein
MDASWILLMFFNKHLELMKKSPLCRTYSAMFMIILVTMLIGYKHGTEHGTSQGIGRRG